MGMYNHHNEGGGRGSEYVITLRAEELCLIMYNNMVFLITYWEVIA